MIEFGRKVLAAYETVLSCTSDNRFEVAETRWASDTANMKAVLDGMHNNGLGLVRCMVQLRPQLELPATTKARDTDRIAADWSDRLGEQVAEAAWGPAAYHHWEGFSNVARALQQAEKRLLA